jgi:magnesium transporter
MNMPQDTSTSLHDPSMPATARLANTVGHDGPTTPRDVAGQLQSGGFFWLDLENPGDDELAEFCRSLQLSAGAIDSVRHPSQRSSFALAAGSVQAVLPAAVGTGPAAWLEANYVTLLLTEQFLFTVHATPTPALQHARHQYSGLDEGGDRLRPPQSAGDATSPPRPRTPAIVCLPGLHRRVMQPGEGDAAPPARRGRRFIPPAPPRVAGQRAARRRSD